MYTDLFAHYATMLKAMAHPRRLEIIHLLRDQALAVSQIYQMLDLPQANISQHLKVLKKAGILSCQRQGKQMVYQLAHPNIIRSGDLIRQVLVESDLSGQNQNLTQVVQELKNFVPLVHDPVCQMRLVAKTADFSYVYQKKRYYFCASGCLKQFRLQPDQYATQQKNKS